MRRLILLILLVGLFIFVSPAGMPQLAHAETTVTYLCTGGEQTFTVPAGVTNVKAVVTSAISDVPTNTAQLEVLLLNLVPGQTLYIEVGCNGSGPTGGFNGGGNAGNLGPHSGHGGGGASDIRTSLRSVPLTTSDTRLVVVGGAGGPGGEGTLAGDFGFGGSTDSPWLNAIDGQNGSTGGGTGGMGGQIAGGGAGGTVGGSSGVKGVGGNGGDSDGFGGVGGGGGGGYFGGGGGGGGRCSGGCPPTLTGGGGGGGGGTSFLKAGSVSLLVQSLVIAPPSITITFAQGPVLTPVANATINSGSCGCLVGGTLSNPNSSTPLTNVSFTQTLPAGFVIASPSGLTNTCGGAVSAAPGSNVFQVSLVTLNAGASCTTTANVSGGNPGLYTIASTPTSNEAAGLPASYTITFNQAPAITSANTTSFTTGTPGAFTVTTTGFPAPAITETGALPSGVTLVDHGDGTATLGGTSAAGSNPTYVILLTAANGIGSPATQTFTLQVAPVPAHATSTTVITSAPGGSAVGSNVAFTATVMDTVTSAPATSGTVAFNDGASLLGSVAVNASGQAVFSTSALAAGVHTINANYGGVAGTLLASSGSVSQTVNAAPTGVAPAISSPNAATFIVGTAGSFTVIATGSPAPTLSITGSLPAGVSLNPATGLLSGTPAAGSQGVYSLVFTAYNGVLPNAVQNFSLSVSACQPLAKGCIAPGPVTISPPRLTKAFVRPPTKGTVIFPVGDSAGLTFTVTNPNATPLTGVGFTDALPAGLVVSTPNGLTNGCGGVVSAVAGGSSISLTGATLAPSSTCTITVNVTATSAGVKNNTTSAVTSVEGGSGAPASASITVS